MAIDQVANFIVVEVSTGYDASATEIILKTGDGAELPDPSGDNYNGVWYDSTLYPDVSSGKGITTEIVRFTAVVGDTATIIRNQENSGASIKNHPDSTYKIILALTKKTIDDIRTDITSKAAIDQKLDDFGTPDDNTDLDSTAAQHGLLKKLDSNTDHFLRGDGAWAEPPGAGGGEVNTGSNQGVGGVGPFYQKAGLDLQFKNINAGSSKVTVTDDPTNHEIDLDVDESNIKLDDLGTPDDNTDLDVNTSRHGLVPKCTDLGKYLKDDGTWDTAGDFSIDGGSASSVYTIPDQIIDGGGA